MYVYDPTCRSALLFPALSSLAEIAALFGQRPIVARHQKAAMYHPFIEAYVAFTVSEVFVLLMGSYVYRLAMTLVGIPIFLLNLVVFSVLVYFSVRLQQSAGQFLYVCLLLSF